MSKKIKIAINGYGRIGRCVHRNALLSPDVEVVAINSRGESDARAHLLKYDSLYGTLPYAIKAGKDFISIDGVKVPSLADLPEKGLKWSNYDVDVVIESTGVRREYGLIEPHIAAGAKKVILTAPPKDEKIPVFVIGANADKYAGEPIVSNASCTTNCLAPVAKVLHEKFGIKAAHLTTVHAATGDQNILDNTHKDLRRSRSIMSNIIPCKTGVSSALRTVLPEIAENFTGQALRVPTPVVSLIDLVAELDTDATVEEVHAVLAEAGKQDGLIGLCDKPLVSVDFCGDNRSAIIDMESTKILNGRLLKLLAWYDNEWGYSARVLDLVRKIAQ